MGFAETVKIKIEVAADNAVSSLRDFRSSISEAEGFTGKLKAGVSGLGDIFKSAATNPAVLAGAVGAVGVAATKAVGEFESLGLAVGKFSDATGLSAEESSRWIEVANDAGISTEALQGAIGKMEKTLGANADAFAKYGVQVVRASDGTVDANATFLASVDALNRIEDPTKRAAAGAEIFGKSWQGMAEIIGRGAPQLRADLESVQPEKVFGKGDVESARGLRDAFDSIKDAGESLLLTVGKSLAPVITRLAPIFADLLKQVAPLAEAVGEQLGEALAELGPIIEEVVTVAGPLVKILASALGVVNDLAIGVAGATLGSGKFTGYTDDLRKAWDAMDKKWRGNIKTGAQLRLELELGTISMKEVNATLAEHGVKTEASAAETYELTNTAKALAGVTDELAAGMRGIGDDTELATRALINNESAEARATGAVLYGIDATEAAAEALEEHVDALERNIDALEKDKDAQNELVDTLRSAADANFAVAEATDDYREFVRGLSDAEKEAHGDQDKLNALWRDGSQKAADAADAVVRQRVEQDKANGVTTDAATKTELWNQKMIGAAQYLKGGAREAILAYVAEVNGIPPERVTDIQAAIDRGDLAEAERLLNEASAARTASIKADADEASIANAREQIRRGVADIAAPVKVLFGKGPIVQNQGAEGGIVTQPTVALIGEAGPEAVVPLHKTPGSAPLPANLNGLGGGDTYDVKIYNYGRDVTDERLDSYFRRVRLSR